MSFNQRRYPRYRVGDQSIAILAFSGQILLKVGKILDISEGGLAFKTKNDKWPDEPCEVNLVGYEKQPNPRDELREVLHRKITVERIPSKLVYSRSMNTDSCGTKMENRCGLQFGKLSEAQASALRHFIGNTMTGTG